MARSKRDRAVRKSVFDRAWNGLRWSSRLEQEARRRGCYRFIRVARTQFYAAMDAAERGSARQAKEVLKVGNAQMRSAQACLKVKRGG